MRRSLFIIVLLTAGCSTMRQGLTPLPPGDVNAAYRLGCPDLLEVTFPHDATKDVLASVDLDGRLPIPGVGKARVQGLTLQEARAAIAEMADLPIESVSLRLVEPRSGRVVVSGPDNRRAQFLVYSGPEPVLDLLRRTGTLPQGSSRLRRVYVLRSNVATGSPPRLYHIDVESARSDQPGEFNLTLEPGDHIYIGETRRSSFSRLVPNWLEPLYRKLAGLLPDSLR